MFRILTQLSTPFLVLCLFFTSSYAQNSSMEGILREFTKDIEINGTLVAVPSTIMVSPPKNEGSPYVVSLETDLTNVKNTIRDQLSSIQSYNECGMRTYFEVSDLSFDQKYMNLKGILNRENWSCIETTVPKFDGVNFVMSREILQKNLRDRASNQLEIIYSFNEEQGSGALSLAAYMYSVDGVSSNNFKELDGSIPLLAAGPDLTEAAFNTVLNDSLSYFLSKKGIVKYPLKRYRITTSPEGRLLLKTEGDLIASDSDLSAWFSNLGIKIE